MFKEVVWCFFAVGSMVALGNQDGIFRTGEAADLADRMMDEYRKRFEKGWK